MSQHRALRLAPTLLLLAVPGGCTDSATPPGGGATIRDGGRQVAYGLSAFLTRDGARAARVNADSARLHNDGASARVWGLEATLYGPEGVVVGTIRADSGHVRAIAGRFTAQGSVVLEDEPGTLRVDTDALHYDIPAARIWTDVRAQIQDQARRGEAPCFETDLTLEARRPCRGREGGVGGVDPAPDTNS